MVHNNKQYSTHAVALACVRHASFHTPFAQVLLPPSSWAPGRWRKSKRSQPTWATKVFVQTLVPFPSTWPEWAPPLCRSDVELTKLAHFTCLRRVSSSETEGIPTPTPSAAWAPFWKHRTDINRAGVRAWKSTKAWLENTKIKGWLQILTNFPRSNWFQTQKSIFCHQAFTWRTSELQGRCQGSIEQQLGLWKPACCSGSKNVILGTHMRCTECT